jgi:hypothetical protein
MYLERIEMIIDGEIVLLKLMLNTLNTLLKKGVLSYSEVREILKNSLNPTMSEGEKEEYLDKIVKINPSPSSPPEDEDK